MEATVNSPAYPLETPKKEGIPLSLARRLLLFFLACCIQMVYIPTRLQGASNPSWQLMSFPFGPYEYCHMGFAISLVFLEPIARSEKLLYSLEHGTDKNHPPEISKRIRG